MLSEQLKLATPDETVALFPPVQLRVAPTVPVPEVMARETTVAVSVLTRLPEASFDEIPTEKFDPAGQLPGGWALTASFDGVPGVMPKLEVLAGVRPEAVAVRV